MIELTTQQKTEYLYVQNQRVYFDNGYMSGSGTICGMASAYLAYHVLGTIWIVKLDSEITDYSFECISFYSSQSIRRDVN